MREKKYEYQTAAPWLLGLALKKATGREPSVYLSEKNLAASGWNRLPNRAQTKKVRKSILLYTCDSTDFAKIGQLIMQNGIWKDKQLFKVKSIVRGCILVPNSMMRFDIPFGPVDESEIKYRFFMDFWSVYHYDPGKKMVIVETGFYNRLDSDKKQRPLQVKLLTKELCKYANFIKGEKLQHHIV